MESENTQSTNQFSSNLPPGYPSQVYSQINPTSAYQVPQNQTPVYNPVQPNPIASNQVIILPNSNLDDIPRPVQCPNCQAQIVTKIHQKNGILTWISCGLLTVCGCCLGCCLFPFCIKSCKDIEHKCPNCSKSIFSYKRIR